jgi:hypothetical protein
VRWCTGVLNDLNIDCIVNSNSGRHGCTCFPAVQWMLSLEKLSLHEVYALLRSWWMNKPERSLSPRPAMRGTGVSRGAEALITKSSGENSSCTRHRTDLRLVFQRSPLNPKYVGKEASRQAVYLQWIITVSELPTLGNCIYNLKGEQEGSKPNSKRAAELE